MKIQKLSGRSLDKNLLVAAGCNTCTCTCCCWGGSGGGDGGDVH